MDKLTELIVIHYPKFAKERQNGSIIRAFSSVMDICPTVLELAGARHPSADGKKAQYRGHEVAPMRGKSWVNSWCALWKKEFR